MQIKCTCGTTQSRRLYALNKRSIFLGSQPYSQIDFPRQAPSLGSLHCFITVWNRGKEQCFHTQQIGGKKTTDFDGDIKTWAGLYHRRGEMMCYWRILGCQFLTSWRGTTYLLLHDIGIKHKQRSRQTHTLTTCHVCMQLTSSFDFFMSNIVNPELKQVKNITIAHRWLAWLDVLGFTPHNRFG